MLEVQLAACLVVVRLQHPQAFTRLHVLINFKVLEHHTPFLAAFTLLRLHLQSQKVDTLNMRKPYNRSKCIIGLFLFEFIVVVQDKLRLVVKPQHSALSIFSHLLRVFHLPRRYIPEFGSVDFGSQIDVFVELDF